MLFFHITLIVFVAPWVIIVNAGMINFGETKRFGFHIQEFTGGFTRGY